VRTWPDSVTGLEDGKGQGTKAAGGVSKLDEAQAGRLKGVQSLLGHLGFNPTRLILDVGTSELLKNVCCLNHLCGHFLIATIKNLI
jgi:hypothetical protein